LLSSTLMHDPAPHPHTAPLSALSLLFHAPSSTEQPAQRSSAVNHTTTSEATAPVVLLSSTLMHDPAPHPHTAPLSALSLLLHAPSSTEQPANSETPNPPLALTLTENILLQTVSSFPETRVSSVISAPLLLDVNSQEPPFIGLKFNVGLNKKLSRSKKKIIKRRTSE
jgi:hypothetical protein